MSIKVMSWVWENGPEKQAERFVLLALADFSNDDGECWPAIKSIGKKTCLSERGIQTILRRLEADGWIECRVNGGRGGANVYRVLTTRNPAGAAPRRKCTPPQMDAETPQMDAINPAGAAPEPLRTINKPSDALAPVIGHELAEAFVDHRKSIKKPMTQKAAELMAKKLRGFSDPKAAIEEAIMNGWQGVFPPKQNHQQQRGCKPKTIMHGDGGYELPFSIVK